MFPMRSFLSAALFLVLAALALAAPASGASSAPAVGHVFVIVLENENAATTFGPNWAVYVLPFIEQDALYRQANVGSFPGIAVTPGTVPAYSSVNNSWRVIVSTTVATYLCPSDARGSSRVCGRSLPI